MTRHPAANSNITIRLCPFEDYTYAYVELRSPGGTSRHLGRDRSFRLDVGLRDIDLDDPVTILELIGDAAKRYF